MTDTILRTNATPIYAFLSFIKAKQTQGEIGDHLKILDCGAGGQVPPLALFNEHGFEAYGIDISDEHLKQARQYCKQSGLKIDFRKGDMRRIPFNDQSFDCVYEHYSMCHLSKKETPIAINEMYRIAKVKGLCFLGFISTDSWPKSLLGKEKEPGEFWDEGAMHSTFTDTEVDILVHDWEILSKEKRVMYLRDTAQKISEDEWIKMYDSIHANCTEDEWRKRYKQRMDMVNYTHIYYILRK